MTPPHDEMSLTAADPTSATHCQRPTGGGDADVETHAPGRDENAEPLPIDMGAAAQDFIELTGYLITALYSPLECLAGKCPARGECAHPGKHPRITDWITHASADPKQIASWWQRWPNSNIGLPLGPNLLLALDADDMARLAELERVFGPLPLTITQFTGRGGGACHFIFQCDERIRCNNPFGPGIDVKGFGGQIVVAPSLHESGLRYTAHPERAFGRFQPARISEWAGYARLERVEAPSAAALVPSRQLPLDRPMPAGRVESWASRGLDDELVRLRATETGGRNIQLNLSAFNVGQLVGGGALDGDVARRALLDAAVACGLPEGDSRKTIRSGITAGMKKPRSAPSRDLPRPNGHPRHRPAADGGGNPSATSRPEIVVTADEHDVNNQVIAALKRDPEIYQRRNLIVRVLRDDTADGARMSIASVAKGDMRDRITQAAKLVRINAEGECRPAAPTEAMVRAVLERGEYPYRHLLAVTRTPVLAPNGRIVQQPGYDAETQLLYAPLHAYPQVPETADRSDAVGAAELLLDVVCDTPFKGEEHRSAWLAYVLTLVGRPAISGSTPMFALDASTRGAGKTFCAEAGAVIALGERVALQTYSPELAEQRKHLSSVFISGARLLAYDNITETLGGGPLNMAITGGRWGDRRLGGSEQIDEPIRAVLVATGNNICIGADLDRRIQHIRLEPHDERPEERDNWRHPNPYAWLAEQHPRLLVAALTVLRAYYLAGQPSPADGLKAWGGFESWSALIRGAIVWLGYTDPIDARSELIDFAAQGDDAQRRVVEHWQKFGEDGASAGEALKALYPELVGLERRYAGPEDLDPHPALREAIEELCGRKPEVRSLGRQLGKLRGRAFGKDKHYLALGSKEHGIRRWVVQRLGAVHQAPRPDEDGFGGAGEFGELGE